VIWRLMGVRIGKRVFDDGVHISEPLLTAVGDECGLNHESKIQCDSQEDGTYKSGPTTLGAGCTVGVGAFVHYGVTMGDGSQLAADSFLMKGETVPPGACWAGNPAREAGVEQYRADCADGRAAWICAARNPGDEYPIVRDGGGCSQ